MYPVGRLVRSISMRLSAKNRSTVTQLQKLSVEINDRERASWNPCTFHVVDIIDTSLDSTICSMS